MRQVHRQNQLRRVHALSFDEPAPGTPRERRLIVQRSGTPPRAHRSTCFGNLATNSAKVHKKLSAGSETDSSTTSGKAIFTSWAPHGDSDAGTGAAPSGTQSIADARPTIEPVATWRKHAPLKDEDQEYANSLPLLERSLFLAVERRSPSRDPPWVGRRPQSPKVGSSPAPVCKCPRTPPAAQRSPSPLMRPNTPPTAQSQSTLPQFANSPGFTSCPGTPPIARRLLQRNVTGTPQTRGRPSSQQDSEDWARHLLHERVAATSPEVAARGRPQDRTFKEVLPSWSKAGNLLQEERALKRQRSGLGFQRSMD